MCDENNQKVENSNESDLCFLELFQSLTNRLIYAFKILQLLQ